ncbi:MAG TPA: 2'-5' RNA ligase family protein [Terriglobia bacterium]|nr:2'-5' RNA ligase family protein [Terriglobia bacterium]
MPEEMEPFGKGYALWLTPQEPMFSLLAGEISRLSQAYSTPRFDPHVTLLSGITAPEEDAVARSASLAGRLKPFRIELGEIDYLDEYFRCLFVSVIPTDPILKAHLSAREAFGLQDETAYLPHLSLIYGKLGIETKKGIAARLGSLPGQEFEVRGLVLYRVRGALREWKCLEKFNLR